MQVNSFYISLFVVAIGEGRLLLLNQPWRNKVLFQFVTTVIAFYF